MRPVCLHCTALAIVLGLSAVKFFSDTATQSKG